MSHLRRLDGLRADRRDFGFPVGGDSRNIPVHVRVFAEGNGTVLPGAGGTLTANVAGEVTTRYANVQLISTGGTVLASAELLGKKRFLTA